MFKPIARQVQSRQSVLKDTTIRDFSGGWNVIDNDLNLDPRFAKVLTNLYRRPDGSLGLRYGTTQFSSLKNASSIKGLLTVDGTTAVTYSDDITVDTTNTSATIEITLVGTGASHKLAVGHVINIGTGFSVGGLVAGDWDGDREIASVTGTDSFTIVADSSATSTVTSSATAEVLTQATDHVAGTDDFYVGTEYFQDSIIGVTDQGELWAVDGEGKHKLIWSSDIAGAQSGSPSGWSTGLTYATLVVKNSVLTVHNGIDKPLVVDLNNSSGLFCQYSIDAGGGSNTNTPVCRYAVAADRYMVLAGDPTEPDAIHISHIDTYGTYAGDGAPNDAIKINMSKRVPTQSPTIRGIAWFQDQLIVAFDDGLALVTLGIYDDAGTPNHTPDVVKFVEGIGSIAHKSMESIGDDFFVADHIGVPSLKQALFTGGVRTERVSQLIDPEVQEAIELLTVGQSEDYIFSLLNPHDNQYMLFVPNAALTETTVFVYTVIRSLKVAAWSKFTGWNYRGGCTSLLGRVFFYDDSTNLYLYTNHVSNPGYADNAIYSYGTTATASRGSALTGSADGAQYTVCALFKLDTTSTNSNRTIISADDGFISDFRIYLQKSGSNWGVRVRIGTSEVDISSTYVIDEDDSGWHTLQVSVDTNGSPQYHLYIDGVDVSSAATITAGNRDLTHTMWRVGDGFTNNTELDGAIGAIFYGQFFVDFSDGLIRNRWFNNTVKSVNPDVGDDASGTGQTHLIYLHGPCNVWGNNFAGAGDFVSGGNCTEELLNVSSSNQIAFEWELPWGDFDARARTKFIEYLKIETQGDATFTVDTYVDNITAAPHLTMEFVGGEATTGTRITSDERLWKWPIKGNIFKHVISGSAFSEIKFISLSFLYRTGSIRR